MEGGSKLWDRQNNLEWFDLFSDPQHFVVAETKAPEQTGQMTLLLNFFDELKRTSVAGGK